MGLKYPQTARFYRVARQTKYIESLQRRKYMGDPNLPVRFVSTSRRQAITGGVAAIAGAAMSAVRLSAGAEEEISHAAEAIHQENVFKASRKRVYEALTETKQFDQLVRLSGISDALGTKPTQISNEVGGTITIFGGHIIGRQLELVPSQRIVQAWRVVDWEPGWYSIAKFKLVEQGAATKIVFDHTGFPKGLGEHLASGWKEHYWDTLEKYLR
jgi:activator of HSP90 ATPase